MPEKRVNATPAASHHLVYDSNSKGRDIFIYNKSPKPSERFEPDADDEHGTSRAKEHVKAKSE